jgi:hypothetical protein
MPRKKVRRGKNFRELLIFTNQRRASLIYYGQPHASSAARGRGAMAYATVGEAARTTQPHPVTGADPSSRAAP